MAVCRLTGKDSGMRAVDISQLPYKDITVDEWFHFIEVEIQNGWGIHHDGHIFILPEMLVVLSGSTVLEELAPRFDAPPCLFLNSHQNMLSNDLFSPFKVKYGWNHLRLTPETTGSHRHFDVFYKSNVFPDEPAKSTDPNLIRLLGEDVRDQGGIIYANRDVWEEANRELALRDNTDPFQEYIRKKMILL